MSSSPENASVSQPLNRLAQERSPYLLQHARNPVDWYPWGPDALARAAQEDRPIFLSVGYSACHWCHVMERESFEDPALARRLNADFVSIKVDREERPDIDEVYMTAVQMMTGHGGWPMSVFLTPDGRPFYGGTYFPPTSRQGRIGFMDLLSQLADAWRSRRDEVEQIASSIAGELQQAARQRPPAGAEGAEAIDADALLLAATTDLTTRLDEDNGGFHTGGPKFPPHHALRLLVIALERDPVRYATTAERPLLSTLDHMALGGIYDHIGGGFHRYATDAVWLLPHFEKMLYDNALLAGVYTRAYRATARPAYARIARETLDWCLDRLRAVPDGAGVAGIGRAPAFAAALDADSEGEEGRYYVWTRAEALSLLGAETGPDFCERYNLLPRGNWRDESTGQLTGTNIPHLAVGPAAGDHVPLPDTLSAPIAAGRAALLAARDRRVPPATDDKVITAWNGLMIGSLAIAGQALDEPRYTDAARAAADFCLTTLRPEGTLLRRYARGDACVTAFLDDHAFLADGLLDLHAATGEPLWLDAARTLADTLLADFWDAEDNGFFSSGRRNERLIAPSKDLFDGALPSANGVAVRVLARLGSLPNGEVYAEKARSMLASHLALLQRVPHGTHTLIEAALIAAGARDLAAASPVSSAALTEPVPPVSLAAVSPALRIAAGGRAEALFEIRIAPGYHVNSSRPHADYLIPTTARVTTDVPAAVGPVSFPAASEWVSADERLSVYIGTALLRVPIAVVPDAASGQYALAVTVHCQACSETECLAPEDVSAEIMVTIG